MTNQTLTEEEINSLVLQQVAALSAEQIQAIIDFQITQEIVMTTMQQLGFQSGKRGDGGQFGTEAGAGQPPQGSAPNGEGGAPPMDGSGQPPQGERGTPPNDQGERNNLVPSELIKVIITLLERKING